MPSRERILVALSGGVDSSVAALLLKQQGHDVAAAYMKNWINEDNVIGDCPWQRDIEDAAATAASIGIPFQVVNFMQEYREKVVRYLLEGYERGLTPNPDVMCNREMKFGLLRDWARSRGFDAVATGHHVRRVSTSDTITSDMGASALRRPGEGGAPDCGMRIADGGTKPTSTPEEPIRTPQSTIRNAGILEGADANKDQSYFLALLEQSQVRDARFPVGHLQKPELRRIAREAGLPTADKKDSQGICFIGEVKMRDFLHHYVPDRPGPILRAADNRELGRHRGLHFYTLGQRRGIGVPSNTDHENYVVVGKRAADNALLVAFDQPGAAGLFQSEIRVHRLSWIGEPLVSACRIEGRVRYRDPRVPLEFVPEPGGGALIRFRNPQRALASGQILALYDGPRLLGGGVYI